MLPRRTTVLIYTEGEHEQHFVLHLRGLYVKRYGAVKVDVACNHGGDPDSIVLKALQRGVGHDIIVAVYDLDQATLSKEVRILAEKRNVILIEGTPSHDAMVLSIIDGNSHVGKTTAWCKREVEKHIPERHRTDASKYAPIFTSELLEKRRLTIEELGLLLKALEGNN